MVARIRTGKSLRGAINYNEHKVSEGKAELIMAHGYSKEINELKFNDKLNRLQKLADLNERVETNCLHASLNFDPSEKLKIEKLQEIAKVYMDKIGFGKQPFLVYEHHDAAHQHVHIVTTNIQKDGQRISMHNLGKDKSEAARTEIENEFGLVKASSKQKKLTSNLKPIDIQKAIYGKTETKRAISNIVTNVVSQYKYTSLAELNAALKQFNVIADRGAENTRMFEKKGLQYSLLDETGNKVGVPIKASSIYGKPTVAFIEKKFEENEPKRKFLKEHTQNKIDEVFSGRLTLTNASLKDHLGHRGIGVVFRENEKGFIYGITYVDHHTKSVFNGSDLGKQYSAAAIKERLNDHILELSKAIVQQSNQTLQTHDKEETVSKKEFTEKAIHKSSNHTIIENIINPTNEFDFIPWQLKKKRKRKKRITL